MQHLLALALVMMTLITILNVASRNILHLSLSFTEELAAGLFVWLVGLGIGEGIRERVHVGVTLLPERVGPRFRLALWLLALACFAAFFVVLGIWGAQMVEREARFDQRTQNLQWPAWTFGAALPVGAAVGLVYTARELLAMLRGRSR